MITAIKASKISHIENIGVKGSQIIEKSSKEVIMASSNQLITI